MAVHSRTRFTVRAHDQACRSLKRGGMSRLVDAEIATSGQSDRGKSTEARIGWRRHEFDPVGGEFGDGRVDVVAHQIQLVPAGTLGRMYAHLRWRHGEDQPAMAGINVGEAELVPQECPVGFGVCALDQRVQTSYHQVMLARLPISFAYLECTARPGQ